MQEVIWNFVLLFAFHIGEIRLVHVHQFVDADGFVKFNVATNS